MTQQRHSLYVLLATAMLLSGALAGLMLAPSASGDQNDIDGFVLADGSWLVGATVTAFNTASGDVTTATTDAGGWYSLNSLEAGDYRFGYQMAGYLTTINPVTISSGGSLDDVILASVPGGEYNISGTVTDGATGIEGANVTFILNLGDGWWDDVAGYEYATNTSDSDGNYSFSGLPNGSFSLRVEAEGYYTATGTDTDVVLAVVNDENLKYVRVVDGDGDTLPNAEVMLYEAASSSWTVTQKLGGATHVVRPSVAVNDNFIFAFHADYATGVVVPGNGAETLEIVLDTPSSGVKVAPLQSVPVVTSSVPVMEVGSMTVLLQLNPGPTADVQITSETTLFDGLHVVALDEEVSFSAAGSSAVVGLTQYEWTFGNASTYDAVEINHTWGAAGSYTVNLTAMDQYNAVDTASLMVLVDGSAPAPAFDILVKGATASADPGEPYNGTNVDELLTDDEETGSTLVFNGSGSSDGESHISSWEWDFGDNTTNSGEVVNKQYLDPGDYPVSLTTTDAAGNSASVAQTVHVNDITRPTPAFTYYYMLEGERFNESAVEGVPITFNAVDVSGEGHNLTWDNYDSHEQLTFIWDFGDNITGSGMQPDHIYEAASDEGYSVLLTVTDRAGNSDVAVRPAVPVGKQERPDLSIARINFSNNAPTEGESIVISGDLKLLNENITQNFSVAFYYDLIDAEHLIANVTVDGSTLVAGIENTHIVEATWSNLPSGQHTVFVIADSGNVVEEQKEDNQAFQPLTVAVSDEGRNWASIALIVATVAGVFAALGYIYRDRIFGS